MFNVSPCLLCAIFCGLVSSIAFCDDVVKIETAFTEPYADKLSARADLGDLSAEKTCKFEIAILNPTDHNLRFESAKASCSCLDASIRDKTINAGATGYLDVSIDVPKKSNGTEQVLHIGLKDQTLGTTVSVLLAFRTAGIVCFKDKFGLVDVLPESKETVCRLPVIITPPVKPKDVVVKIRAGRELIGKIAEGTGGQHFAEFRIGSKDLEDLKGFGSVQITDSDSGRSDEMPFAVRSVEQVAVLPSTVRFSAQDGENSATGLVRVINERSEKEPLDRSAIVKCYFQGKQLNVNAKPLGKGVYRFQLRQPDVKKDDTSVTKEGGDEQKVLVWSVVTGGKERVISTPVVLVPTDNESN